jgi:hypothetical protein
MMSAGKIWKRRSIGRNDGSRSYHLRNLLLGIGEGAIALDDLLGIRLGSELLLKGTRMNAPWLKEGKKTFICLSVFNLLRRFLVDLGTSLGFLEDF